ncbi:MAG: 2Fe-2S iron-sulfur cluster binding domain-containing protein [Deinococcus-Thermus bacterium]|nr:2Fe-2S iron-sulfur cluster binding domain-containing protein [Deinococcota bacterium]
MPTLTVGDASKEFPEGTRLVLAIEALGSHVGHRCGGKARCTTCRVTFDEGEPEAMTEAEAAKLEEKGLAGETRLSCQIVLDRDMTVTPVMTLESEGWSDTGPTPADEVEPEPAWTTREAALGG